MNPPLPDLELSLEERIFLDREGYLILGKLLDEAQLTRIHETINHLLVAEGDLAGSEVWDSPYIRHPRETGADRLADLVNKGPEFDIFYTHPRLLAAVKQVLGPEIKLSSLNYRAAKPGNGAQKIHADWHEAVTPPNFKVCNSIWLLDDFTAENGATRLVPGSHLQGKLPQDVIPDTMARHPDEILLQAPAGTVVLFNSHLWHGGTTNRTKHPRRAIHSYFCCRDQPQQLDQRRFIRPETRERLFPEILHLLDCV